MQRTPHFSGFTLSELLLAISFVALVASIILSAFYQARVRPVDAQSAAPVEQLNA